MDKCKKYKWFVNKSGTKLEECFYGGVLIKDESNKTHTLLIHRYIMDAKNNEDVDHRDRNTLNNRKSNLRKCNTSENISNAGLKTSNKSGHRGVCWSKTENKWIAYIMKNYHHHTLGYFTNIEDAIECRHRAEIRYFGEFRPIDEA